MESSSETKASSIEGYSTPPRSNIRLISSTSPKLLTSSELKRCFSPIHSPRKKRRCNLIRKIDCLVPFEHHMRMPMVLRTLFDPVNEQTSVQSSSNIDDSVVPSNSTIIPSPMNSSFIHKSSKTEPKVAFSISETVMREKLKILLAKK